jgi:hypothetical protein
MSDSVDPASESREVSIETTKGPKDVIIDVQYWRIHDTQPLMKIAFVRNSGVITDVTIAHVHSWRLWSQVR